MFAVKAGTAREHYMLCCSAPAHHGCYMVAETLRRGALGVLDVVLGGRQALGIAGNIEGVRQAKRGAHVLDRGEASGVFVGEAGSNGLAHGDFVHEIIPGGGVRQGVYELARLFFDGMCVHGSWLFWLAFVRVLFFETGDYARVGEG